MKVQLILHVCASVIADHSNVHRLALVHRATFSNTALGVPGTTWGALWETKVPCKQTEAEVRDKWVMIMNMRSCLSTVHGEG